MTTPIWFGGEDIDFTDPVSWTTTSGYFRSGYARGAVQANMAGVGHGTPFPAVTDGWISGYVGIDPTNIASKKYFGLGNVSQNRSLLIGNDSTPSKLALWKIDGTTATKLGSEAGTSVPTVITKFTMHVVSLGASGAVDLYVGDNLVYSYSGDLSWLNDMDCAVLGPFAAVNPSCSELTVADGDLRAFSVASQAINAAGDSNAWNGAYTDISENTINDATVLYTNATGQDALFNTIDLPAGTFSVKAQRIVARVAKSSGATAGSIALGVKNGGTVNVDSPHACDTAFKTIERLMTQNPVTSSAWAQSEMNGNQVVFRSAA